MNDPFLNVKKYCSIKHLLQVLNQVVKLKNKSKIFATFTYSLKQAFSRLPARLRDYRFKTML